MSLEEALPRVLRTMRRVSQADVARITGINRFLLSRYENGRTTPGLDNLQRLAACYGTFVSEIVRSCERAAQTAIMRGVRPDGL